jgi:ribosome maturation factor RimP
MEQRSAAAAESGLEQLAARVAREAGVELVELSLRGAGAGRVLRVDIDRAGPAGVNHEDCQRVSRALGSALDESDLIPQSYHLEVSSPGIDRAIRSDDDIRRNSGRLVRVITNDPHAGRRCHRGRLLGAQDDYLLLEVEGAATLRIARREIVKAQQDLPF